MRSAKEFFNGCRLPMQAVAKNYNSDVEEKSKNNLKNYIITMLRKLCADKNKLDAERERNQTAGLGFP